MPGPAICVVWRLARMPRATRSSSPWRGLPKRGPRWPACARRAPAAGMQMLVALGWHPARQRNAALSRSTGAIIVFLDNDCAIGPSFWDELERDFAEPEVEVVGGPALLRPGVDAAERDLPCAAHASAGRRGRSARGTRARGDSARSSQTELILCNLAARRAVFEKIGHSAGRALSERGKRVARPRAGRRHRHLLRSRAAGLPARSAKPGARWRACSCATASGRTKQLQVSGHFTVHQLAPLVLLAPAWALAAGVRGLSLFGAGWLLVALLVAGSLGRGLSLGQRLVAGLVAPLVPMLYAWGRSSAGCAAGRARTPKSGSSTRRGGRWRRFLRWHGARVA